MKAALRLHACVLLTFFLIGKNNDTKAQSCIPTGCSNMIFNGDFSLGDTGFVSGLSFATSVPSTSGNYYIGTDAAPFNNQSPPSAYWAAISPDNSPFLICDGDVVNNTLIWLQTVTNNVFADSTYNLCFLVTNTNRIDLDLTRPQLQVNVTDQNNNMLLQYDTDTIPVTNTNIPPFTNWTMVSLSFATASNTNSITLSLNQVGGDYFGFDFAVEDISMFKACSTNTSLQETTTNPFMWFISNNQLHIKTKNGTPTAPFTFCIYDISGKALFKREITGETEIIDLTNMQSSMLILRLNSLHSNFCNKLVYNKR